MLHNIIKDSENLEKSLRTRQKAKGHDWTLVVFEPSGCFTTTRYDCVVEITAWAQEQFQQSLTVNTVRRAIHDCKLKLHHPKKKPRVNMIQKRSLSSFGQSSF